MSILIPCYNAERWIEQAIDSALAQIYPCKEVIVVDDGSTDRSVEIIRRYDGRIRWATGPNLGGNAARNRLLDLARGRWLQYLDADDYLLPQKVASQMACVAQSPDCDVVYGPTIWEHLEKGQLIQTKEVIPEPHDPWSLLARWRLPQTGGSLWRKARVQSVGKWRIDQKCCQEHELYLRLLQAGAKFIHCPACLAVYRDWNHGARVSRKSLAQTDYQRLIILERLETYLLSQRKMTALRHQAINDTRHLIARRLWREDKDRIWATKIVRRIVESDPTYCPGRHLPAPRLYSIAYRLLGFRIAQLLASIKQTLNRLCALRDRQGGLVTHSRSASETTLE